MSAEQPSPKRLPRPLAWTAAAGVCALGAALLAFFARLFGVDSPMYAIEFHFVGMACAVWVDQLLAPRLDGDRFRVSEREVRVYRALGAVGFMHLLRAIGWEAAMRKGRSFRLERSTLRDYDHATRQGENAHGLLFLLTVVVAALALAAGHAAAAAWLAGTGVVFHVYPVMLQRTQRARLQPLLEGQRCRSSTATLSDR